MAGPSSAPSAEVMMLVMPRISHHVEPQGPLQIARHYGLSMAVGNYLSIRSHESVLEAQALPEEEAFPLRHGGATFLAFVLAGAVPLLPYMIPLLSIDRFTASIALTLLALFAVGASRALIANVRWWKAGLEMLSLGAVVAALAYGSGAIVAALIGHA